MTAAGTRVSYLTVAEAYNLNHACRAILGAGFDTFHVGSSIERPDYRDVDLRAILDDVEFDTLFVNRERLDLLNVAVSEWISARTSLPIDFQFQRRTKVSVPATNQGKRRIQRSPTKRNGLPCPGGNTMTAAPLDLDAREAAEKAATPGPWREGIDGNLRLYGPDGMGEHSGLVASAYKVRGNLSLIALLRNAAPALFAAARERDALKQHFDAVCKAIGHLSGRSSPASETARKIIDERDASRAEITRLREALEEAVKFIEDELQTRKSGAPFSSTVADPYDQDEEYNAYVLEASDALAKARAALGLSSALGAEAPSLRSPDPDR